MILPQPPLLLVTDRSLAHRPLVDTVRAAVDAGCRWIMLREKDLSTPELTALAREVIASTTSDGSGMPGRAPVILVNGDVGAAVAANADGVHLPRRGSVEDARTALGPEKIIGVSCHSRDEAETAARSQADYITLSPIFLTDSKPGYGPALGLDALHDIAADLPIPVVALAGVSAANARDCLRHGASGVAVMGPVMRAHDPETEIRSLVAALRP